MTAPAKRGLDCFPLSVDLISDPKLRRPKMQYGYLATIIYISLLGLLYRDKGYYIDYRNRDEVVWCILGDLQGKYQPDYDTVVEVIEALVACELFSGDLFQRDIITSKRAQMVFYSATVTRKTVDICDEYWLLTPEEMRALSVKHCYYLKTVNRPNNGVNHPNNGVNRAIYPQSKVKESKVYFSTATTAANKLDSIGGGSSSAESDDFETQREKYGECIRIFESLKGAPLNAVEMQVLPGLVDSYGREWVKDALTITGKAGKSALRYTEGILKDWRANGRDEEQRKKTAQTDEERRAEVLAILAKMRGEDNG